MENNSSSRALEVAEPPAGRTSWAASRNLHFEVGESLTKASGSYRKCLRHVKQLIVDLEGQGREIAKALVEAQKVGIDCLDADDTFAILPDISKDLKVHRSRCMEQEITDFDIMEEFKNDIGAKLEALQAAYESTGSVKRLRTSEDEVRALQSAVQESHRECQEAYQEGEADLREQHSELSQYETIYKRLLKTAQSLTEDHRARLVTELLEGEVEEKKKAQAKAQKKRAKHAKGRAKTHALCNGKPEKKEEEKSAPLEEEDTAWESEYASAGNWKHLMENKAALDQESASRDQQDSPRDDAGSSQEAPAGQSPGKAATDASGCSSDEDVSAADSAAKATPPHVNSSVTSSEGTAEQLQGSRTAAAGPLSAVDSPEAGEGDQPETFDTAWGSAVDKWLDRLSGRVAAKVHASSCRGVAQRNASFASPPPPKSASDVSAAWEEEAGSQKPAAAAADKTSASGGGAPAAAPSAMPRQIFTATVPGGVSGATPPAGASAGTFPVADGWLGAAAAAKTPSGGTTPGPGVSDSEQGGMGDFLQQLMPRPQPAKSPEETPPAQQTTPVQPPRPQPTYSSDGFSGMQPAPQVQLKALPRPQPAPVSRDSPDAQHAKQAQCAQQAQPQPAGASQDAAPAQPVSAAGHSAGREAARDPAPSGAPNAPAADVGEDSAAVLPVGPLRPGGTSAQPSLLLATATRGAAAPPPPPPPPCAGAGSAVPFHQAQPSAGMNALTWQQKALITPPRAAQPQRCNSAELSPPLPPPPPQQQPGPWPAALRAPPPPAGAAAAPKAQARALVTPARGTERQSRERSISPPPSRLVPSARHLERGQAQSPAGVPASQDIRQGFLAADRRAEALQVNGLAGLPPPVLRGVPEPAYTNGFRVKLSDAGAAAAAKQQAQLRSPVEPQGSAAAANEMTPPGRASFPVPQEGPPAQRQAPAKGVGFRGQLADDAKSVALSGNADPAKVEWASAQIMQALGLTGRRFAAKPGDAKADVKSALPQSAKQPPAPQQKAASAGQLSGQSTPTHTAPDTLPPPKEKPPSSHIAILAQHRATPPAQPPQPGAKPSPACVTDPGHDRAAPPRPLPAAAAAVKPALQQQPPHDAPPYQELPRARPSLPQQEIPGDLQKGVSSNADAAAVVSVPPALPLRFGSLPPELVHPLPASVAAALDKLNGVVSAPGKPAARGSGSAGPGMPVETGGGASSAAMSAASSAQCEVRVPQAVGQLLSSLFGAPASPGRPGSEVAPSSEQLFDSAGTPFNAADRSMGLSSPPADEQESPQERNLYGPSHIGVQPLRLQRASLLHTLRTGRSVGKRGVEGACRTVALASAMVAETGTGDALGQAAGVGRDRLGMGPRARRMHAAMGGGELAAEMLLPLCCPITEDLIEDPVIAADGITYERAAIAKWISRRKVSYVTKSFMRPELVPNRNVQAIIDRLANA